MSKERQTKAQQVKAHKAEVKEWKEANERLQDDIRKLEAERHQLLNEFGREALLATHNAVALAAIRQACGLIGSREAMTRIEGALREFWKQRRKYLSDDDSKYMPRVPRESDLTFSVGVDWAMATKDSFDKETDG